MPSVKASSSAAAPLAKIVRHLETTLGHATIGDWANALNGLHVENNGQVHRIGAAVDACEATFAEAARRGVDLLLVHHGLLWPGAQRIEGAFYRKLRLAFDANLAVFSSHLPLDQHPRFGNNALLTKALGLKKAEPFLELKGSLVGMKARASMDREELRARIEKATGAPVKLIPGGGKKTRVVGVVSGGGGGELARVAAEGVDTYITGEASHPTFLEAEELGVNLYLAGHYATETFGVKALAAHLSKRYRLPWEFIDHPTGL